MIFHSLVADESIDFGIVQQLRTTGFTVYAIIEQSPSITDAEVLAIAFKQGALLLTEDKDFGELVFRLQKPHKGILLIRILQMKGKEKALFVANAIAANYEMIHHSFSVLDDLKLRIRS